MQGFHREDTYLSQIGAYLNDPGCCSRCVECSGVMFVAVCLPHSRFQSLPTASRNVKREPSR